MSTVTRTRDKGVVGTIEVGSNDGPVPSWSVYSQGGWNHSEYVTFSPYELANHKTKIRLGEDSTTSLTAVRIDANLGNSQYVVNQIGLAPYAAQGRVVCDGIKGQMGIYLPTPDSINSISDEDANNRALQQLVKRALKVQQQFAGMTFLGELHKTVTMIHHPLKSLFQGVNGYLRSLKKKTRGTRPRSVERSRVVENSWLESSYGWRPFFSDIKGAAQALASVTTYRLPRQVVSGKGYDERKFDQTTVVVDRFPLRVFMTFDAISSIEVKYTGAVRVSAAESLPGLLESVGFMPRDFLPTLWELVPYSFLVDYFSNIGAIIQAACFPTSNFAWIRKSTRIINDSKAVKIDYSFHVNSPYYGLVEPVLAEPGPLPFVRGEVLGRTPFSGSVIPTLRLQLPGFGLKWLNIAALASTHREALVALRE
jgi:hypothetical protein